MGIFNFLKKKKDVDETPPSTWLPSPPPVYDYDRTRPIEEHFTIEMNKSDLKRLSKEKSNKIDFTHLDENGELPFGWAYHNKEFTDKIKNEFSYFLNCWIKVRGKNISEEYATLKSLITYIKDAEKLCKSKGECFLKWFSDCVADREYLKKRQADLDYIEEHFDELLKKESCKRDIERNLLPHPKQDLLKIIRDNPGILQTDIYKMFDTAAKEYILSELYFLEKNNLVVREKSGRTYSIKIQK